MLPPPWSRRLGFGGGNSDLNISRDRRTLFFRERDGIYSISLGGAGAAAAATAGLFGRRAWFFRRRTNFSWRRVDTGVAQRTCRAAAGKPVDFTWTLIDNAATYRLEIEDLQGNPTISAILTTGIGAYRAPRGSKTESETPSSGGASSHLAQPVNRSAKPTGAACDFHARLV